MDKDLRKSLLDNHEAGEAKERRSLGAARHGEEDFFVDPRFIRHDSLKEAVEIDRDFWPQYQLGSHELLSHSTAIGPDY